MLFFYVILFVTVHSKCVKDYDDKLVELYYFRSLVVWKSEFWTEMFDEGEDE